MLLWLISNLCHRCQNLLFKMCHSYKKCQQSEVWPMKWAHSFCTMTGRSRIRLREFKNRLNISSATLHFTEVSLIVSDFKISVYSSSCNSLFIGLMLPSFLSLFISWHSILPRGCQFNRKKEKTKKWEWDRKRNNFMNHAVNRNS